MKLRVCQCITSVAIILLPYLKISETGSKKRRQVMDYSQGGVKHIYPPAYPREPSELMNIGRVIGSSRLPRLVCLNDYGGYEI